MKIIKLNCVACGSPISIPENLDTFFCSSCGSKLAVDRSEGAITLNLIEMLTKEMRESAERTNNAIKESTYVTKTELKRVQISQTINTEEIKLNTTRQEIRSLSRKSPLLAVEQQQLSLLRLVECDIMQRMRNLRLELAKLDDGWQGSVEVFKADLAELDKIIEILKPSAVEPLVKDRLDRLQQERNLCEINLSNLEKETMRKSLKSLQHPAPETLSLDEVVFFRTDIQNDLKQLADGPKSDIKQQIRDEILILDKKLQAILPRKKVEAEIGALKSLDLQRPFPEIPWELIPLIEQVGVDLNRIDKASDTPEKKSVRKDLEKLLQESKKRQALDIPSRKIKAAKRRKIIGRVLLSLILLAIGVFFIMLLRGCNNENDQDQQKEGMIIPDKTYQETNLDLFEIVSQRTYFRAEDNIQSEELAELHHGDILFNLGQSEKDPDWFLAQSASNQAQGYLYTEWISPISGKSVDGQPMEEGETIIYQDIFSDGSEAWLSEAAAIESGQREFHFVDGAYQIDATMNVSGYVYSKVNTDDLPQEFTISISMEPLQNDSLKGAGVITNFYDPDNFNYFLLTSENYLVIGCQRNGLFYTFYNTQILPNNKYVLYTEKPNKLSVEVNGSPESGPTIFNYAVNGATVFSIRYDQYQDFDSTIALIVWSMEKDQSITARFDEVTISIP